MSLLIRVSTPCPVTELAARELSILLPGGGKLAPVTSGLFPTEAEMARALLGQLQSVLGALAPAFTMLEALLAIVEILKSVPKVPTNPAKFTQAMAGAAKKFAALAKLVPQLSVPMMLGHVLDVVIRILVGARADIDRLVVHQARVNSLALKIVGSNDVLADVVACANRLNRLRMCAIDESFGPMKGLFELLNLFLSMVGLPKLEALGAFGHDPFKARQQIDVLIQTLRTIRRSLPVPPLVAAVRC
jgi:hypothetical protein